VRPLPSSTLIKTVSPLLTRPESGAPTFAISAVLTTVRAGIKRERLYDIPGEPNVKFAGSIRLRMFAAKGTECVCCGRQGSFFALEYRTLATPHLNLYTEDGVLMTMDHIRPRSKGGAHNLTNLQPMCEPCNAAKADTFDINKST
jgi:hypothetical protein